MVREGSLVVVPRDSVVEREEAKEDCWENNTGIAEAEGASPSVVDETEEIPQNTYDPSCFYMDGGFLHYESDTVTSQIGIDVSAHHFNKIFYNAES